MLRCKINIGSVLLIKARHIGTVVPALPRVVLVGCLGEALVIRCLGPARYTIHDDYFITLSIGKAAYYLRDSISILQQQASTPRDAYLDIGFGCFLRKG